MGQSRVRVQFTSLSHDDPGVDCPGQEQWSYSGRVSRYPGPSYLAVCHPDVSRLAPGTTPTSWARGTGGKEHALSP